MSRTRGDIEFRFLIETAHSSNNLETVDLEMVNLIIPSVLHRAVTVIFILRIVIIIAFKSSMKAEPFYGSLEVMAASKVKLINPWI